MRSVHWFLAGVVAAACIPAQTALADGPRFEITPFVGYRIGGQFDVEDGTGGDDSVDVDDGASLGVDLGLYRDSGSFYELLYSRQSAGIDSSEAPLAGVDVVTEYFHFGGTLVFADQKAYAPYLSLTVGATRLSADKGNYDDETKFSGSIGGGVRFPFNDTFAATLGARAYVTLIDSDTDLFCVSAGGNATCLLKSSGGTYWQGEAQLGITARF